MFPMSGMRTSGLNVLVAAILCAMLVGEVRAASSAVPPEATVALKLSAAQVEAAGIEPHLAQALALLTVTPLAFVANKRWTFRLVHARA